MKVLMNVPEKSVNLATALLAHEFELITNKLKENGDNPISVDLANSDFLGKEETAQVGLAIAILAISSLDIDE